MTDLLVPVLAHAGPGSTWQAMVVVAGVLLTGVVLSAGIGWVLVERPGDLLVPLAGVGIASSLGVLAHEIISDAIGWGLPLAVVMLATLLLGALTPLDVRFPAPLPMGAIALAALACIFLYVPLTVALHPPPDFLPVVDDVEITIVEPADGAAIEAGDVEVVVEVTGGSVGPGGLTLEEVLEDADPEEAGALVVSIEEVRDDGAPSQRDVIEAVYQESCTFEDPCDRVTFPVPFTPGTWTLSVEFTRADGFPFAPLVRDRITVEVS